MAHAEHSTSGFGHHVIPKKTLLTIFGILVALTVLTWITATQIDLGVFDVPVALAIACTKAALVVLFFMALKYDSPVNSLVFIVGSIFVVVFLAFTLFDTLFRGDIGNMDARPIIDREQMDPRERARRPALIEGPVAPSQATTRDEEGGGAAAGEGEAAEGEVIEGELGAGEEGAEEIQETFGVEREAEAEQ